MKTLRHIAVTGVFTSLAGLALGAQNTAAPPLTTDATPPAPVAAPPVVLPPERNWRFGLAAGYGSRTNPLIQSDDIPVIVDVDLAWFGKRWFFDNGDVGFSVIDNDHFTTNLIARVNSDRAFFSRTNTKYVTFMQLSGNVQAPAFDITGSPLVTPEPLKPPKRDYAIEAGIETLLDGDWGAATLRAFHDVSGTHDGYEISVAYDYRITRGRFSFSPSLGIAWKDTAMSTYYWGVHPGESSNVLQSYEARGGISWEAGVRGSYYLSEHFRVALSANYERLQHSVANSPIVEDPYVLGYFAGVAWSF